MSETEIPPPSNGDIYGEDCPHAWNLVDLRYRRTADGIEFYDIDYPYGCAYMGRA